ncbi:MFS transporter [Pectobacterium aroidearum]|uniref:MFS transporter n=1 Tax=Pectobacterium aroidearum TaxID=1201031 RepID=UPI002A82700F|nr:MFS transporter [Pectobacterium aroidearum]MDY4385708.1 MFS transporter [Pectobacterium aroidearum]
MEKTLGINFWIFRISQVITALGYSASSIAAMWWVLGEYHKMIYVSFLVVPPLVISALSQPFAAPAGDRYDKKKLIITGLGMQLISYFIVAKIIFSGEMNIAFFIAFEILSTFGKIIFNTGSIGIIPCLVPSDKITDGMNITHRINSTMSILGGVFGGGLVTFFGTAYSFAFLTTCIAISTFLCFFMKYKKEVGSVSKTSKWLDDVKEGFNYTVNNKVVFGFFMYSLVIGLSFAPMLIAFPYLIKEINGLPALFAGLLATSMGLGVICGSFIYPFACKVIDSKNLVYVSSFLFFLALLMIGTFHNVAFVFAGQFIIGLSRNWINVTIDSLLLIHLPSHLRTRVLSNLSFFAMINMPLAMMISGFLMDTLGVYNIMLALSAVCFIAMLLITTDKMVRKFLSADPDEAKALLKD